MLASSSLVLILLSLFFSFLYANEVLVGSKKDAWKIPSSQSDSLNLWAQSSRFVVGDTLGNPHLHFQPQTPSGVLAFIMYFYDKERDYSVLQVTKEDYVSCNTSNPIAEYNEGNTKVTLGRSGPFYFISDGEGHCEKGQKMIVVVLSQRHGYTGISPSPSPVEFEGSPAPAVAPSPTSRATSL
ncbi:Cu_bind_like domain-containing protein, partial [Cephalotus follicularis]